MSLSRQLLREFRPFFRILEEPFGRSPAYMGTGHRSWLDDSFFRDFSFSNALRPAVDVTEQGNSYVVEAELPGVKKENIEVRIGDGGRSVTIEGRVVDRRGPAANSAQPEAMAGGEQANQTSEGATQAVANVNNGETNQLSSERSFVGTSSFTRTVWLPRQVDRSNVTAKLDDGILTLTIPKAEDPGSVQIPVQ